MSEIVNNELCLDEDGFLFHTRKGAAVEATMPPVPLADTHGHLTSFRKHDAAAAVARAALAGVRLLVVPVDPADDVEDTGAFFDWFDRTLEGARDHLARCAAAGITPPAFEGERVPDLVDNVHIVAGVHPYGAQQFEEDEAIMGRLRTLLASPRCVGVGEFGIDFGPWSKLSADVQLACFRSHLELAHELGLPVELHLRDGADDTRAHDLALGVLSELGVGEAGCDLHCYTSGPEVLAPFSELGCYAAFGGAATFAKSDDIRAAALACPAHLILTETDSPYMAPHPLRGEEAEPAMVQVTAARLAEHFEACVGTPREVTYRRFWENAQAFFGL